MTGFYRWYLEALAGNRNPILDDRAALAAYVSKPLLAEIDRRVNSAEGFDEDYFTRAQDYFDDWKGHIAVSNLRTRGEAASATVTFGSTKQSRHRLAINLICEGKAWKIAGVGPALR
nr:DUF3828 domain-containing protein [uncultured Rhodopila sp.]